MVSLIAVYYRADDIEFVDEDVLPRRFAVSAAWQSALCLGSGHWKIDRFAVGQAALAR